MNAAPDLSNELEIAASAATCEELTAILARMFGSDGIVPHRFTGSRICAAADIPAVVVTLGKRTHRTLH